MSVTAKELLETANAYAPRALYESEWRRPIEMLRRAASRIEALERNQAEARSKQDVSEVPK